MEGAARAAARRDGGGHGLKIELKDGNEKRIVKQARKMNREKNFGKIAFYSLFGNGRERTRNRGASAMLQLMIVKKNKS